MYTQCGYSFSVFTSCDTNTSNNNNSNEQIALNEIKTEELKLSSRFVSVSNLNDGEVKNNVQENNHNPVSLESNESLPKERDGESVWVGRNWFHKVLPTFMINNSLMVLSFGVSS